MTAAPAAPTIAVSLRTVAARPAVRNWALAALVYLLAVFHRSSLGVAGLEAERRFGISAGQLGVFVLLQLGVYAAMQIPTGVLVDRYGPRRILVVAATLMGAAQLGFAVAPDFDTALLARALLGCGDAMTFISVLRFVAARFSARRYPLLVAVTAVIGTLGNILATLPLQLVLGGLGWTASFALAATASLVTAAAVWFVLDDRTVPPAPVRSAAQVRRGVTSVSQRIAGAWALAGTRLGFWVHFACMSSATAFGVLWGLPYLVDGAGFTATAASTVLLGAVVTAGVAAPLVGWLVGRRPNLRVALVVGVCSATVLGWTVLVACFGARPPHALVAGLFLLTFVGGPASMVAFALARDYNSERTVGIASGVVNVGGFVATVVISVLFGQVVSLLGGSGPEQLRLAVLVPVAVQAFGTWRVLVWVRRLRARVVAEQRAGHDVPVPVTRHYPWDDEWELSAR